jgi:hypothetical protein
MTGGVMQPGFIPQGGSEGPCFIPNQKKKKKKKTKLGYLETYVSSLSLTLSLTYTHKMRGDVGSCEGKDKVSLGC